MESTDYDIIMRSLRALSKARTKAWENYEARQLIDETLEELRDLSRQMKARMCQDTLDL